MATNATTPTPALLEVIGDAIDGGALAMPLKTPRPTLVLRLQGDRFLPGASAVVLAALVATPPAESGFTGECRDEILATSTATILSDNTTVTVVLGSCLGYAPMTDEQWWVSAVFANATVLGRAVWRGSNSTILVEAPLLPPPSIEGIVRTATVVTAVLGLANPAALTSMQTLALFGGMPCVSPSLRKMANEGSWTLCPLGMVVGPIPALPHYAGRVTWNVVVVVRPCTFTQVTIHTVGIPGDS